MEKTVKLRLSITGACSRLQSWRGSPSVMDKLILNQFGKHFLIAKEEFEKGNIECLKEFFDLYG